MKNTTCFIRESLKRQLQDTNFDIIDVTPILYTDRILRLKALQKVLVAVSNTSKNQKNSATEYLVRLRQKKTPHTISNQENLKTQPSHLKKTLQHVYLPNGKLNIPYLMKNADLLLESRDTSNARKIYETILKTGEITKIVLQRLGKCYKVEDDLKVKSSLVQISPFKNEKNQRLPHIPLQAKQ